MIQLDDILNEMYESGWGISPDFIETHKEFLATFMETVKNKVIIS